MDVRLTETQEQLIAQAIAQGRYQNAEEAVREAIALWAANERRRAELIALIEEGEADIEAGRYTDYTEETLQDLVEDIKREGRALRDARAR
jgi:antitoxin ParD1/3/4